MRYILLGMLVFVLGAAGVIGYSFSRERPVPPVTGDYASAAEHAQKQGARLILVVDEAPPFL